MSLAGMFGGIVLAHAGLGAVHGIAGPFGGLFHAPHGAVCAALLPHVVAGNIAALRRRSGDAALERYAELARMLTARDDALPEDGAEWLREQCAELYVKPLSHFAATSDEFPLLVEKSRRSSSMKGNPVDLADEELAAILEAAL